LNLLVDLDKRALALVLATAVAVPAEGLRQIAYYDPPGILTVCRGHTGPDVAPDRRYSLSECDRLLTDDMRLALSKVDSCRPGLPVEVLAAFGDAVFNLGPTVACDLAKSTAARKLRAGDLAGACNELVRWNKATIAGVKLTLPGLSKRREMERDLCLKGLA